MVIDIGKFNNKGQRHGFWVLLYHDGEPIARGKYHNGKMIGLWKWDYSLGDNKILKQTIFHLN